jgi:hypothetical protein
MEVSRQAVQAAEPALNHENHENIEGGELIQTLLSSTGLPEDVVGEELGNILESAGASPATLTIDELRTAMLAYLEATLAAVGESSPDGMESEQE